MIISDHRQTKKTQMTTNETNAIAAARLLADYTGNRFALWSLTGSHRSHARIAIMSALLGRKAKLTESGVTHLRNAFYEVAKPEGNCVAAREVAFATWCGSVTGREVAQ